ncbi:hypothetical protein IFR05_007608 [Cadophora sp. M221]|nr:hypothetical protein IFR05_007608 [Cadophora sp. M221]
MSAWWQCCGCHRELNPELYGEDCPDCGHQRCEDCSGELIVSQYKPSVIYHTRAKAKHLPIILETVPTNACADFGSEVNCISETYARMLGAHIEKGNQTFKLPISGRFLSSIGTAIFNCRFIREPSMPQYVVFYVFRKLIRDVVLGRQFLRTSRTLDLHVNRLQDAPMTETQEGVVSVKSVGNSQESIKCWLDKVKVQSLPDTGAEVNMVSTEFAAKLGYHTQDLGDKLIQRNEGTFIEFVDGSTVPPVGTIPLQVSCCDPSRCSEAPRSLVDSSFLSPRTPPTGVLAWNQMVVETFYVVHGLEHDAVLGETLLMTVDAFNLHANNIQPVEHATPRPGCRREHSNFKRKADVVQGFIAIGRKKRRLEGSNQAQPALSEKKQFEQQLSIEMDRYEKEVAEIEDRFLKGNVYEELVPAMRAQASQDHMKWMRENKSNFDRFHPGYWGRVMPQEI